MSVSAGATQTLLFKRGTTYQETADATSNQALLGTTYSCGDYDPTATTPTKRLGITNILMVVRNASGVALLPKMCVQWKTGKTFQEVVGYTTNAGLDGGSFAGVVDEFLPSTGAPANAIFYILVDGISLCLTSATAGIESSIAEWAYLHTVTAAASTTSTTAGRVMAMTNNFVGLSEAKIGNLAVNTFIMALSAKTTAQTNNAILCRVKSF